MRNRYYEAETGRFISEDPVRDGTNWYGYCGGNPVMFADPSGLKGQIDTTLVMAENGSKEHYQFLLIKYLIEDMLGKYITVDEDGIITESEYTKSNALCTEETKKVLSDILSNDEKTVIFSMDSEGVNGYSSLVSPSRITINPNTVHEFVTGAAGEYEKDSYRNLLGDMFHECIHAWDYVTGRKDKFGQTMYYYNYNGSEVSARLNEAIATGIVIDTVLNWEKNKEAKAAVAAVGGLGACKASENNYREFLGLSRRLKC